MSDYVLISRTITMRKIVEAVVQGEPPQDLAVRSTAVKVSDHAFTCHVLIKPRAEYTCGPIIDVQIPCASTRQAGRLLIRLVYRLLDKHRYQSREPVDITINTMDKEGNNIAPIIKFISVTVGDLIDIADTSSNDSFVSDLREAAEKHYNTHYDMAREAERENVSISMNDDLYKRYRQEMQAWRVMLESFKSLHRTLAESAPDEIDRQLDTCIMQLQSSKWTNNEQLQASVERLLYHSKGPLWCVMNRLNERLDLWESVKSMGHMRYTEAKAMLRHSSYENEIPF